MTADLPAAVLWDMDGTLVDTEPYWMRAETELVTAHGGAWSHEDGLLLVGSGLWNSAAIIRTRGVELSLDEIVDTLTNRVQEQIDSDGVPWRPGARELLAEVRERGIPTALVTMSVDRMARQIADRVGFAAFDALVTGDRVAEAKPHPESYLTAAGLLGVRPEDSIAIEDSVAGLASAVSAGTMAIGVPHIVPLPEAGDHTIWTTLEGRTVDDLATVVATSRASAGR